MRAGAVAVHGGRLLSDKQFVQGYIADSYAQLKQFRLFVLYTAWEIDKYNDYKRVRKDIAAIKVLMPGVLHDIAQRALQVHGALGASNEMPFTRMVHGSFVMGLADGPTEVHKMTVAQAGAARLLAVRRPVAQRAPAEAAAHFSVAVCTDPAVQGRDFLPDGVRRRVVADVDAPGLARAVFR